MIYKFFKRLFDVICALLGIIGTSPIWIVSIILTEISDPGPLFYFANRVGKDNKKFKMWKFRSMRVVRGASEASLRPEQDRDYSWWRECYCCYCTLRTDLSVELVGLYLWRSVHRRGRVQRKSVTYPSETRCVLCEACELLVGHLSDLVDGIVYSLYYLRKISTVVA